MTVGRWFEANLSRILKARAAWAAAVRLPAGVAGDTLALCLAALRPRNQWPENTRFYQALRARLAENPLGALVALGAAVAALAYLGFGPAALRWTNLLFGA